jgi:hypothetical protein
MAWERRGANTRYYYRSRRTADGRVVKDYLGRGPRARSAAQADAAAAAGRAADRAALVAEQARLAGADLLADALGEAAGLLFTAAMLAGGFRRCNYGPWRKRRGRQQED